MSARSDSEGRYINHYRCPCGEEWHDRWSCMCNDRCPACNKEIEPHDSEDLGNEGDEGESI